jgi:Asp-tRNA(Asn)/Glu-tRNA(Gln) amidotransferase A subunit family amidase
MAMSKHFNDGLLLQIASTYEQSKGWFTGKLDLPAPSAPKRDM